MVFADNQRWLLRFSWFGSVGCTEAVLGCGVWPFTMMRFEGGLGRPISVGFCDSHGLETWATQRRCWVVVFGRICDVQLPGCAPLGHSMVVLLFSFCDLQLLGCATSGIFNGWSRFSASVIFNFGDVQPLGYSVGGPAIFSFWDLPLGYSVGGPAPISFCDLQLPGSATSGLATSGIFSGPRWSRCSTSAIFNFWDVQPLGYSMRGPRGVQLLGYASLGDSVGGPALQLL